jgi:hypothetical protein
MPNSFSQVRTMIGIKPITIEEHCFKILILGKVILDYVFNDPVVLCSSASTTLVITLILVVAAIEREDSKMVE